MDFPMIRATWQTGLLSAISNILGQAIRSYQANVRNLNLTIPSIILTHPTEALCYRHFRPAQLHHLLRAPMPSKFRVAIMAREHISRPHIHPYKTQTQR